MKTSLKWKINLIRPSWELHIYPNKSKKDTKISWDYPFKGRGPQAFIQNPEPATHKIFALPPQIIEIIITKVGARAITRVETKIFAKTFAKSENKRKFAHFSRNFAKILVFAKMFVFAKVFAKHSSGTWIRIRIPNGKFSRKTKKKFREIFAIIRKRKFSFQPSL
jgi:hypothetical protein